MKNLFALFLGICISNIAGAQKHNLEAVADSITQEGMRLYQSESASWYGTDVFMEKCKEKRQRIGGYFSYNSGYDLKNIFYTNDAEPRVLATLSFPYENVTPAGCKLDTTVRAFSAVEIDYYQLRKNAMQALYQNKDTLFKFYQNMGTNPVPIITNGYKKVYILTSPKANGVVVFGNDYLLNFDEHNHLTAAHALHKSIIPINYDNNPADSTKKAVAAMHTHLASSGDYISATDICTLMLYEKFAGWENYYVMSANDVSLWDCKKDSLLIITREAWDKINKDHQERHPKDKTQ